MAGLNVNWEQIGNILVLLFVISIVFETALTPIGCGSETDHC